MFTVPLTLGCLEKRSSDNEHGTGDGLLQEVWLSELPRTGSGELAGKLQNHHQ